MEKSKKLPQLRILATSYCGRKCIYCRPSGEGAGCSEVNSVNLDLVIKVAKIYKKYGGNEIKISGGDPIFWSDIVKCVYVLKHEIGIESIELITRSPKIVDKIDDLINSGLDVLNFSLDTINKEKFSKITSVDDFNELYGAIQYCSKKNIYLKLNTVVMRNINDDEIDDIISFCRKMNFKQVKLLDMISDLHNSDINNSDLLRKEYNMNLDDLYIPLEKITESLKNKAISSQIIYQGGLGHPMNKYVYEDGLEIVAKDSLNGAWYGSACKKCKYYPCHDALMALRLTSDSKLQFCLMRNDNCIDLKNLGDEEIEKQFVQALKIYENAYFVGNGVVKNEK